MTNEPELYVTSIRITNTKLIKEAELNFGRKPVGQGQLTEIVGDNETGKTSIHEAIVAIFEGGKHPELIRNGSGAAEAVMKLSDGHLCTRIHTPSKSTLTIVGPDGVKVGAEQTYIEGLSRAFACDPLRFDDATPKERLKILLEISPVAFHPAEITMALGPGVTSFIKPPTETLDLQKFGRFVSTVTDRRAAVGNQKDEKASSIETLRKALPEGEEEQPKDWIAVRDALEKEFAAINAQEQKELGRVDAELRKLNEPLDRAIAQDVDQANGEFRRLLDLARKGEYDLPGGPHPVVGVAVLAHMLEIVCESKRQLIQAKMEADNALQSISMAAFEKRQNITLKINEVRANADAQLKQAGVRESIKTFAADCERLGSQYDAIAGAVKELDKLRKTKVDDSLVEGLEVDENGDISMHGIPWDEQNTATRLINAVSICSRGAGDLGFMACDGGERLGPKRRKEFEAAVVMSGMQAILFTVASKEWIDKNGPEIQSIPAGALKVKK